MLALVYKRTLTMVFHSFHFLRNPGFAIIPFLFMLSMLSSCIKSPSEPAVQEPSSITLSSSRIVLTSIGQRVLLTATVLDQDSRVIQDATIFFRSGNVNIATVSDNGLVTAVSMGTTQINVSSGYATASATVTVMQEAGRIEITPPSATLEGVGETVQLKAEVYDTGSTIIPGAVVVWSSSNPEVATVDANGIVTAVSNGTTQITATSGGVSTSRPVYVVLPQPAARIELNISEATLTSIGQSLQLDALVYDIDGVAIPSASVAWSSSHPAVATVDSTGLVSAVSNGTTLITATSGGVSTFATIHVVIEGTVPPPPVASSDRDVLEAFYNATNGPSWTNSTNWLTEAPLRQWYGVTSNDDGRVTELTITSNNLDGTLPSSLGDLEYLEVLNLELNDGLSGSIPEELGNLSNLTFLKFSATGLSGSIPGSLGGLSNLRTLHLNNSALSGSIPSQLGNLTSVTDFHIGHNQLSGTIPQALGNLSTATYFHVGANMLTGTLPTSLVGLSSVQYFHVGMNKLSGTIPSELGDLGNLQELLLFTNEFTGDFPVSLANLTELWRLSIAGNDLTGCIPPVLHTRLTLTDIDALGLPDCSADRDVLEAFYNATNGPSWTNSTNWLSEEPIGTWHGVTTNSDGRVTRLSIVSNNLDGTLPSRLGDLEFLTRLDLELNSRLRGSIPQSLGNLSNLTFLKFSATGLSGSIPGSLGGLSNLRTLHLNNSALSGSIPSQLGNLTSVTSFHIGHNQLSGTIPSALGNLSTATYFHVGANKLTGTLPNLSGLSSVTYFHVGDNMLSGTIPSFLGSLSTLRELLLFDNSFTGDFPKSLANLPNLTRLSIAGNDLTGCIPTGLREKLNQESNDQLDSLMLPGCEEVPTSITITPTSARLTWIGETEQLNAVVYNSADNRIRGASVNWSSNNRGVATVNSSGLVTAVSNGSARITASSGDVSASAGITVSQVARSVSVTPSSATLTSAGETEQLNAVVYDEGGTRIRGASVNWSSDDSGVATVSSSGLVTAVANGSARITASSGSASDYATITVEIESGDRDVLVALYNATDGDNWTTKSGWLSDEPIGTWHGVTTNSDGRVTRLSIVSNNLDGTLPSRLGDLEFLTRLDLELNSRLRGSIPSSLGNLSNLTFLKFSATGLSGSIPGSLGGLSNLRTLHLNNSALSGSIPSQLGNLTSVTSFHIGHNQLSGTIPSQLGNLSTATYFHVGANKLTGTLPNLSGLSSVTYFHVGDNMLSGTIPSWLGSLTTLTQLLLFDNSFTGNFPTSLANLPNLTRLSIAGNDLTGCIPTGLREKLNQESNDQLDSLNLPDCP